MVCLEIGGLLGYQGRGVKVEIRVKVGVGVELQRYSYKNVTIIQNEKKIIFS